FEAFHGFGRLFISGRRSNWYLWSEPCTQRIDHREKFLFRINIIEDLTGSLQKLFSKLRVREQRLGKIAARPPPVARIENRLSPARRTVTLHPEGQRHVEEHFIWGGVVKTPGLVLLS